MKTAAIAVMALILPACALQRAADKIDQIAGDAQVVLEKAKEVTNSAKEKVAEMDTDKDGTVSKDELIAWILGLGLVGGGATAKTISVVNAKRRENARDLHAKIDASRAG